MGPKKEIEICAVSCQFYVRGNLSLCSFSLDLGLSYPYNHHAAYLGQACRHGLTKTQKKQALEKLAQSSPSCTDKKYPAPGSPFEQ
jgi:hypothetical protein